MPVSRPPKQKWVEIWVELAVNYGHVEMKVGNSFWGFWPDDSKERVKTPRTSKNPNDDLNYPSSKGGYYGRLEPRSSTLLAYEYTDRLWGEQPLIGRKVPFHRFRFRASAGSMACLRKYMNHFRKNGLEYNAFNRAKARNCVGLTLDALRNCSVYKGPVRFRRGIPNPKDLWNHLLVLSGNDSNIKYDLKWLEPPHFT